MVENRLTKNSSNIKLFNSIKKEYNDALKLNDYSYDINMQIKIKKTLKIEKENENAFGSTTLLQVSQHKYRKEVPTNHQETLQQRKQYKEISK